MNLKKGDVICFYVPKGSILNISNNRDFYCPTLITTIFNKSSNVPYYTDIFRELSLIDKVNNYLRKL